MHLKKVTVLKVTGVELVTLFNLRFSCNTAYSFYCSRLSGGEKSDSKELINLVEKSRENGMEINDVLADTAYASKENLEYAAKKDEKGKINFKLIAKMNPIVTNGNRKEDDGFIYNKDADMMQCPEGELSYMKSTPKTPDKFGNMKTDEFKTKSKERYKIEAKNSELKNSHGYGHAIAGGIHNMELQAALTMFAVNLKRIFKLMEEK